MLADLEIAPGSLVGAGGASQLPLESIYFMPSSSTPSYWFTSSIDLFSCPNGARRTIRQKVLLVPRACQAYQPLHTSPALPSRHSEDVLTTTTPQGGPPAVFPAQGLPLLSSCPAAHDFLSPFLLSPLLTSKSCLPSHPGLWPPAPFAPCLFPICMHHLA